MLVLQRFALALALATGLSLASAPGARAAIFSFDVLFGSGPLTGQTFTGLIEIKDSDFVRTGFEYFFAAGHSNVSATGELLGLSIEIDGIPFEMTNDGDFPDFPFAFFNNGALSYIDFLAPLLAVSGGFVPDSIEFSGVDGYSLGAISSFSEVIAEVVPEPGIVGVLGLGLLGLSLVRRGRTP